MDSMDSLDSRKNRHRSVKANKTMSISLPVTCLVFSLCLFLYEWDGLTKFSYTLHELVAVLINIGMVAIPIQVLIGFMLWIRYRLAPERPVANRIWNMVSVVVLVWTIYLVVFSTNAVTSNGVVKGEDIRLSSDGQYLLLGARHIIIPGNLAGKVQAHQRENSETWYCYTYKYSRLVPNQGKLTTFAVVDIVTCQGYKT